MKPGFVAFIMITTVSLCSFADNKSMQDPVFRKNVAEVQITLGGVETILASYIGYKEIKKLRETAVSQTVRDAEEKVKKAQGELDYFEEAKSAYNEGRARGILAQTYTENIHRAYVGSARAAIELERAKKDLNQANKVFFESVLASMKTPKFIVKVLGEGFLIADVTARVYYFNAKNVNPQILGIDNLTSDLAQSVSTELDNIKNHASELGKTLTN